MNALAISVIVVGYRRADALLDCLQAATLAAAKTSAELIVVDNGSLSPLVKRRFPTVQLVMPGFNSGFAGGVVKALATAQGRWVALINDDARMEPDALALMLAVGEHSEKIGAVATQVRFSSAPDRVNSAGIEIDRLGIATERLAGTPTGEAGEPCEVFGPSACFALYRRAMLRQVGGFDERFFAYLEDVDLAWRARAAGWSCVYEPRAIAYHDGSASSRHGSARKYFLVGRNRVWLLARNATTGQLVRAWPAMLAYDCAYVAYVAATDRTLAPLRGRLVGLRSWRQLRREHRGRRQAVALGRRGLTASLRQHRAYQDLARSS